MEPTNSPGNKNKNLRRLIVLAINTILFFAVYRVLLFYAERTDDTFYAFLVLALYTALLLGFLAAYFIYNRFLYRKNLTPEDLPDTMSAEEKEAFLADGRARLEKSKWMMTIIFPLVLTFLIDAVDIFILDLFR
jgi:hypothetical protein